MTRKKRDRKFQMCFTEDEILLVTQQAKQFGLTISEFIRRACLQKILPKQVTKISAKTYFELGKIGNNLNQIAKVANTAMQFEKENAIEYNQVISEIEKVNKLIHQVRQEIVI